MSTELSVTRQGPPAFAPRRTSDDYAFLPAALEITETPLSPIRGTLILTICALTMAAVALSYFGRVDIIATAQGKIQPIGRTKTVQPLEPGRVLRIAVTNGQSVRTGDLLLTLDGRESEADEAALTSELRNLKAEALRRKAALIASSDPDHLVPVLEWEPDLPESARVRETRVLDNDLAQLDGQVATLQARLDQSGAEAARLRGTIVAQEALAATTKQRLDMRSELLARNAESKASVIDAQEAYGAQLATLAGQKGQVAESEASGRLALRELQQARRTFRADNAQKLADVERRIDDDVNRLAKAKIRTAAMEMRSPVDGRVEGLAITTPGQVVASGEQIMQIVPAGTALEIQAYLRNEDIGFVQPGQTAAVKVQAFPFTDYGTIEAEVVRVAQDAVPLSEAEQREGNPALASRTTTFGGVQRVQNLFFPITLVPRGSDGASDRQGRNISPGMSVTVEVRTGSRRILSYLLAPLVDIVASALRER